MRTFEYNYADIHMVIQAESAKNAIKLANDKLEENGRNCRADILDLIDITIHPYDECVIAYFDFDNIL